MPRYKTARLSQPATAIFFKERKVSIEESEFKDLPTLIKILKAKGLKFNGKGLIGKVDKWSDPKKPEVIFIRQTI